MYKPYVLCKARRPVSGVTNSMENNLAEKLEVCQLGKKFPKFYVTRWLITLFTSPYPEPNQSIPLLTYLLGAHFHIILPSTPKSSKLGFSPQVFPSDFCVHVYSLLYLYVTSPASSLPIRFDHPNNNW
jgi:hypothetical protein